MPSKPCVGDTVTLHCETIVTIGNISRLSGATITRDGEDLTSITPNHMLLRDDNLVIIGVVVNSVTMYDDGIEYTCSTTGAPLDFKSSLILNVTGIHTYISYIYNIRM